MLEDVGCLEYGSKCFPVRRSSFPHERAACMVAPIPHESDFGSVLKSPVGAMDHFILFPVDRSRSLTPMPTPRRPFSVLPPQSETLRPNTTAF